ncbi:MAG: asparagine synthase-related protein [Pseudomonadota bacterium]
MSAFLAVFSVDNEAPDRGYLERMSHYLARIGPDEQQVWTDDQMGFVSARVNTGASEVSGQQFCETERFVVVGDVRLDGKAALIGQLRAQVVEGLEAMSDLELLMQVWVIWGERLSRYLMGDFAVVIWDRQRNTLHGLRDQMGIKQLFYAQFGSWLIVSTALNSLREHARVSNALNEQAVLDFLVFGFNSDFASTMFRDIKRLPPAHLLSFSRQGLSTRRYWSIAAESPPGYRDPMEYVAEFEHRLSQAVEDRMEVGSVAVAMSGGLDSTSIAAFAREAQSEQGRLSLYTMDVGALWPDDREAEHAALVAQALEAKHVIHRVTLADMFKRDRTLAWALPEPSRDSFRVALMDVFDKISQHHTVALTGHGADPLLRGSPDYFADLMRAGKWAELLKNAMSYYRVHGRRPPLAIRTSLKKRYERAPWQPVLPHWLRADVVARSGLVERFQQMRDVALSRNTAPDIPRAEALQDLSSPIWPPTLARFDPQTTGLPLEFRHPFLDVRLIEFTLSMPPSPWFYNKQLLRAATKNRLPEAVRLRRKAMPSVSPVHRALLAGGTDHLRERVKQCHELGEFIDTLRFDNLLANPDKLKSEEVDQLALPLALVEWLWLTTQENATPSQSGGQK